MTREPDDDGAPEGTDPAQAIRLGVLGCATIARRVVATARQLPGLRVVAVASRDADKAADFTAAYGGEPVTGYERLLARPDIDAVYVPLPAALHARWVAAALHAGKHVLAEKPLAVTHAEAVELTSLAEARGLVLRQNYMFVQHGQHQRVREMVEAGRIGALRSMSATFTIPRRPADDIRMQPKLGGGALLDTGGYPIRAARLLLGDELRVLAATLDDHGCAEVDLGGSALLRRADGVTAALSFGLDHAYQCEYQLVGSAGRIRLERAFTPPATLAPTVWWDGPDGTERLSLPAEDQCAATLAAFVAAIGSGRRDGADLRAQARLVDAVRAAAGW